LLPSSDERFPDPSEASWLAAEHQAACELLKIIIRKPAGEQQDEGTMPTASAEEQFAERMDQTLAHLEWFVESAVDHYPKLYIWVPGVALCSLAFGARLSSDWLQSRIASALSVYARLPGPLIFRDEQLSQP